MEQYVEVIGLLATTLVLISFLFTGEKQIRVINIIGAAIFVVYGLILQALSVWLMNGILIIVHLYKLYKLNKVKKLYQMPKHVFTFNNTEIETSKEVTRQ